MKGTIIYGNGAMARVLHSYARHTMNIVAFTVDDHCIAPTAQEFCGLPLLPFSSVARTLAPADHSLIVAVGYLHMNDLRRRKREEARGMGYASASYVHPDVMRHDGTTLGEGCIILDHVSIHPGCRIDDGVFISSNVNIGHDCVVGEDSWINAGVAVAGGSSIGARCFLGVNASVGHGVSIGERNYISANTFIGADTQADQVYLSEAGQRLKMRSLDFLAMTEGSES
ncbi:MAG: acetyltransferase [Rhodocyclaceae bacterium]|nr:acetyltransferase [Rhodocyclaceae bacterium]